MWFESLTGFREGSPSQVRANLVLEDNTITSKVSGRAFSCGYLETPSLTELRTRAGKSKLFNGTLTLSEVVGDVKLLHADRANAGAFFQVASQFNLLEMVSPSVTPEHGIDIYESDPTQGPACAIAAGAGTIFRNYFADVNGQIGQSSDNQIDCLLDFGNALGNTGERLWAMQNGYARASKTGLEEISKRVKFMTEGERDALRQTLRIGIQRDTQVTLGNCKHTVTQAYCSALPVAYSEYSESLWEDFAQLILEASYEATLCAALVNSANTKNNKVFLTLLGGGAFGNHDDWIFAAIKRALKIFADAPLDVAIVSHGISKPRVLDFLKSI